MGLLLRTLWRLLLIAGLIATFSAGAVTVSCLLMALVIGLETGVGRLVAAPFSLWLDAIKFLSGALSQSLEKAEASRLAALSDDELRTERQKAQQAYQMWMSENAPSLTEGARLEIESLDHEIRRRRL
jgi:hypothetical protein